MVATLQKLATEKPKSISEKGTYLHRNYSVRIEQQKAILKFFTILASELWRKQNYFELLLKKSYLGYLIKRTMTLGMEESFWCGRN